MSHRASLVASYFCISFSPGPQINDNLNNVYWVPKLCSREKCMKMGLLSNQQGNYGLKESREKECWQLPISHRKTVNGSIMLNGICGRKERKPIRKMEADGGRPSSLTLTGSDSTSSRLRWEFFHPAWRYQHLNLGPPTCRAFGQPQPFPVVFIFIAFIFYWTCCKKKFQNT